MSMVIDVLGVVLLVVCTVVVTCICNLIKLMMIKKIPVSLQISMYIFSKIQWSICRIDKIKRCIQNFVKILFIDCHD